MDHRPSSRSPRRAKLRLAAPVPGAIRNGSPGMSNEGSCTPRSLADTESRTLARPVVHHRADVEPGDDRAGRVTLRRHEHGLAVQRGLRGDALHGRRIGALEQPVGDLEVHLAQLDQEARPAALLRKAHGRPRGAQALGARVLSRQQSGRHVVARQLGPVERLLEPVDADLAEERVADIRGREGRQLEERPGEGVVAPPRLVEVWSRRRPAASRPGSRSAGGHRPASGPHRAA